jgi:hypothetical protein
LNKLIKKKYSVQKRAGGAAQVVQCLPSNRKALTDFKAQYSQKEVVEVNF